MAIQRHAQRKGGGLELAVELAQRGAGGDLRGAQKVRHGAHGEQQQAAVQAAERVARQVEEEHVAETEHQTRHRHRHEAQEAQHLGESVLAGLLQQPGAGEDQQAADQRAAGSHQQAVEVGLPAAGQVGEGVVAQR
ncbi:hypothetical protein D3C84_937970 [compost metagenome]